MVVVRQNPLATRRGIAIRKPKITGKLAGHALFAVVIVSMFSPGSVLSQSQALAVDAKTGWDS